MGVFMENYIDPQGYKDGRIYGKLYRSTGIQG